MNCMKCGKTFQSATNGDTICQECKNGNAFQPTGVGGLIGWICPVCGAGLSPYTARCSCQGYQPMKVTC
jgi:hypothetical protein